MIKMDYKGKITYEYTYEEMKPSLVIVKELGFYELSINNNPKKTKLNIYY